jgi:hypothetical protein
MLFRRPRPGVAALVVMRAKALARQAKGAGLSRASGQQVAESTCRFGLPNPAPSGYGPCFSPPHHCRPLAGQKITRDFLSGFRPGGYYGVSE